MDEWIIDRTGFDDFHIHDWPLVVHNGVIQTLDMQPDDPRRQEFCPWCRGFGGMRMYAPDVCPGCRGTCLVSVRQQVFLMDRLYARLDDVIYPDWPHWVSKKCPLLGNKAGQWNNSELVMSARGRAVEAIFDAERLRKDPGKEMRVQFPPPEVEGLLRRMGVLEEFFPAKPVTLKKVGSLKVPTEPPEYRPVKYFVKRSDEIEKLGLKPYKVKVTVCTTPLGGTQYLYDRCPASWKTESGERGSDETGRRNTVSESGGNSEENCFSTFTTSGNPENLENEPEVNCDELTELERERYMMEATLNLMRDERNSLISSSNDSDSIDTKEFEENLMKCQEKIIKLQRDLEGITEKISNFPIHDVTEVVQFSEGNRALARMSVVEIRYTQTRNFTVTKASNGEFLVSNVEVEVKGEDLRGGNVVLSADDYVVGMTLAKDEVFFTKEFKVRANDAVKIVANC